MQATVVHLQEQLETSQVDAELLSASRAREEQLSQQLKTLTEELLEAKKYHTPVGTWGRKGGREGGMEDTTWQS